MVAFDLCILNDSATKLGYLSSQHIAPIIINDTLTVSQQRQGQVSMPVEFWLTADGKQTLMVVRSQASDIRAFCDELVAFVNTHGFANVALLTSAFSPIKRERDSNREIPEVFAYCNNALEA